MDILSAVGKLVHLCDKSVRIFSNIFSTVKIFILHCFTQRKIIYVSKQFEQCVINFIFTIL